MKRLRHPIRSIREPFGKAGLTVAILALVLAMVGGAYAAGGLTKAQEKQVTKIAKKYAGKPGAPGAAGTNGTNGTNGKDGGAGTQGTQGTQGIQGDSGKSVNVTEIPTEVLECSELGGAMVEPEEGSNVEVCNGPEGPEGPEGALGTAGTTLPTNATETGDWDLSATVAGTPSLFGLENLHLVAISFPIPLSDAPDSSHAILVPEGNITTQHCSASAPNGPGGTAAQPKADSGYLCVYVRAVQIGTLTPAPFASGGSGFVTSNTYGADLAFEIAADTSANGSFAVTGG